MSKLKLTTLANQDDSASVPADTIVSGTAKAWVNFNGTGTVAIRRAFNVSSITDNGTGDYTVNFTTAMPDINYSAVYGGAGIVWGGAYNSPASAGNNNANFSTTSIAVRCAVTGSTYVDQGYLSVAIFS